MPDMPTFDLRLLEQLHRPLPIGFLVNDAQTLAILYAFDDRITGGLRVGAAYLARR